MRVAALYDVHGNLPALEAVLAEVDADVVLFGGDLASGPLPCETVDLARSLDDAVFVLGNADVLSTPSPDASHDEARRWVEKQLGAERSEWLATRQFSWSADGTLFVHANPVDFDEPVTEATPDERLERLLRGVSHSRVVSGHVHMQFRRRIEATEWVGAGSVGMPYEDAPGAYWALVDGDAVEFRRTDYDRERAAATIRSSGYPLAEEFAAENVLVCPSRAEVLAFFAGHRPAAERR